MNHNHHKEVVGEEQIYTCPMHPEVRKHEPGKCPGCGMDLIPEKKKQLKFMLKQMSANSEGARRTENQKENSKRVLIKKIFALVRASLYVLLG